MCYKVLNDYFFHFTGILKNQRYWNNNSFETGRENGDVRKIFCKKGGTPLKILFIFKKKKKSIFIFSVS